MKVFDVQNPAAAGCSIRKTVARLQQQFDDGAIAACKFHAESAVMYSLLQVADKTRFHAAQVPSTAGAPHLADKHLAMARMYAAEKNLPAAIHEYLQVLVYNSTPVVALQELAFCLLQEKRFGEAAAYFEDVLQETNETEEVLKGYGLALRGSGRYAKAIEVFGKAHLYRPATDTTGYYLYQVGLCYQLSDDNYMAMAYYTYALQANPGLVQAYLNMGVVYANDEDSLQDDAKAFELLKKAEVLAGEQNMPEVFETIWLNLARMYYRVGEYALHGVYERKILLNS